MNADRIKAIDVMRTFLETDGVRRWIGKFAFKFIVVNGVLVIGPIRDHAQLYAAFVTRDEPAEDVKAKIGSISLEQFGGRNWSVTAAGEIDANGVVTGWKSTAFRVETPEDQRPEIAATVLELFEAGKLVLS